MAWWMLDSPGKWPTEWLGETLNCLYIETATGIMMIVTKVAKGIIPMMMIIIHP